MLLFPNCKINIGLNVIQKRTDGFHDLETIFYPVKGLCDLLEAIVDGGGLMADGGVSMSANRHLSTANLSVSGLVIDGDASTNLCVKAYHLLKNDFPVLPNVHMHLHKLIPMGAGLGGGSADGAFALCLLNDKFELGLSQQKLVDYALQLGSDCPFFMYNEPCFAHGRGENLEPIELDLSAYFLVLINPNIHVNTGWAFGQLRPQQPAVPLKELIRQPMEDWKNNITNNFEAAVSKAHPAIAEIKKTLYSLGAVYAAMSGSGSTVFGFFSKNGLDVPNLKKRLDDLMPAYFNWIER